MAVLSRLWNRFGKVQAHISLAPDQDVFLIMSLLFLRPEEVSAKRTWLPRRSSNEFVLSNPHLTIAAPRQHSAGLASVRMLRKSNLHVLPMPDLRLLSDMASSAGFKPHIRSPNKSFEIHCRAKIPLRQREVCGRYTGVRDRFSCGRVGPGVR